MTHRRIRREEKGQTATELALWRQREGELDRSGIQVFPQLADGTLGVPSFIATVEAA